MVSLEHCPRAIALHHIIKVCVCVCVCGPENITMECPNLMPIVSYVHFSQHVDQYIT
jgi:hypothetical protein